MDCSTPFFPVHHQLPELAQTHVHSVGDTIQWPHAVVPFHPALYLSQHQGLFLWLSSSHRVAKVLEFQLQHQSFQWMFRTDFIYHWLVWSPCRPRDSSLLQHHSSKASILRHSAFLMVQLSHPYVSTGKILILKRICLSEIQTKLNIQHIIGQPSSGKTLPSLGDLCNFRAHKLRIHPLLISRKSYQITHVSFKVKARFRSRN